MKSIEKKWTNVSVVVVFVKTSIVMNVII
jgi:hypothetical protein